MAKSPLILFGNGKGGVGKTTSSILVTLAFAHASYRVGIRDTDSQASFTNCLSQPVFKDLPIVAAPRGTESAHDLVIADGPPSVDEAGFLADFDRCDLFCLVTRTGTLDLQTTARSYEYLAKRRPRTRFALLINAYDERVRLDRDLESNLAAANLDKIHRLRSSIADRELYRHVVYAGWTGAIEIYRQRHSYRETIFKAAQDETAAVAMELYGLAINGKA